MKKEDILIGFLSLFMLLFLAGATYYYFDEIKPLQAAKKNNVNNSQPPEDNKAPGLMTEQDFRTQAVAIINAAEIAHQEAMATGAPKPLEIVFNDGPLANATCYTLAELGQTNNGYQGHVLITLNEGEQPEYYLYLNSPSFSVKYWTRTTFEVDGQSLLPAISENISACPIGNVTDAQ